MKSKKWVTTEGGREEEEDVTGRTYRRGTEKKKEAVGEKEKLIERQRQKEQVSQKRKRVNRVWKRTKREERESICHHRLPQLLTDYSCLQNSLRSAPARLYWLASNPWLLQREVSMTCPITDEKDPAHFPVSPPHCYINTQACTHTRVVHCAGSLPIAWLNCH